MSLPNPAYRNATYLLTRRCAQREFSLVPTPAVTAVIAYAVAKAAACHGVEVHAALALTNHWHAVITVSEAVASDFARDVHSEVARCVNRLLDRREALWSSDGLSLVRLVDREAVFEKMVYTEVNAVAAGLVSSPEAWRGFRVTPRDALCKARRVSRPRTFYRKGNASACPEEVAIRATIPACLAGEGEAAFVKRFEMAVKERVKALRAQAAAEGRSFLGMEAVLETNRRGRPKGVESRRGRRPRIACADPVLRRLARAELSQFRSDYRKARAVWLAHEPRAYFPHGTQVLSAYPNVVVLDRPPDTVRAAA